MTSFDPLAPRIEPQALRPFREAVGVAVRAVPAGLVVTYGTVALMVGRPGAARQVGAALRRLSDDDPHFPWHRVINAQGGISTYRIGSGELQEALLRSEGIVIRGGRVDLARFGVAPDQRPASGVHSRPLDESDTGPA